MPCFSDKIIGYSCQFSEDVYHDDLFSAFGITFPPSLKGSVVKRRAEFLAGRYCGCKALNKLNVFSAQIDIGKNRSPVWPEGILGSISHSSGCAIAVACHDNDFSGVGVDVESIVSMKTINNIRSQILCEDEMSRNYGVDDEQLVFSLVFSVKESFFKAMHSRVGKYFGFSAVSVVDVDMCREEITLRINDSLHESMPVGSAVKGHFSLLSGQVVTLIGLP